jgi:hypothetical protein
MKLHQATISAAQTKIMEGLQTRIMATISLISEDKGKYEKTCASIAELSK